jgi:tetratricopeptide (TPR) repeat protein
MQLSSRNNIASFAALIALLTVLAYSNTIHTPFVFDDIVNIIENTSLSGDSFLEALLTQPKGTGIAGRPVIQVTLVLNHAISGEKTWSYHLFNLTVHVLAALTLFGIIRRALHSDRLKHEFSQVSTPIAFACSLLWALHPLQTESVTYIIQRCESLMGLFFLLTFYCAMRGWQSSYQRHWHLAALLSFLAGVGSKEVIVMAPILLFLCDMIFFHESPREAFRASPLLYAGMAFGLVLLALLVAAGGTASSGTGNLTFSVADYWITQPGVILKYLSLVFWPHPLCIDHAWPLSTLETDWPSLAVMGLMLSATVTSLIRYPAVGYLFLWFFLLLAPTSLMPLPDLIFEHRMYLPLAAVVLLSVAGMYRLLCLAANSLLRVDGLGGHPLFKMGLLLFVIVATSLGSVTYLRNLDYQTDISLWADAVRQYPTNSRARANLGAAHIKALEYSKSLHHLQESLRLEMGQAIRYAEMQSNLSRRAENHQRYLLLRPVYAFGRYNLGVSYLALGMTAQSVDQFREALRFRPDYPSAHSSLGIALYLLGNRDEAFQHLSRAVQLKPDDSTIHTNLGAFYRLSDRPSDALRHLSRALQLNPDNPEAHFGMGLTLRQLGKHHESERHLLAAASLREKQRAEADRSAQP